MLCFDIKGTIGLCIKRSILVIGLMGFFAGLPLLMCGPILAFWLAQSGVELSLVSLTSLASLPYALKFLWASFIEHTPPPIIGKMCSKQKGWLILSQVCIGAGMIGLSQIDPQHSLWLTATIAFLISTCAATQESIMLTYDLSRLNSLEYSMGEAMRTSGYRLGMLCSSVIALYVSDSHGWGSAYFLVGIISLLSAAFSCCLTDSFVSRRIDDQPPSKKHLHPASITANSTASNTWLNKTFTLPWNEIKKKEGWLAAVALMFIYKAGDNLIGNLHNVFYNSIGFSKVEIAEISKIFGTFATISGCFVGGVIINRIGLGRALIYGCFSHAAATLLYIVMCNLGHNKPALYGLIFIEHFTGGFRSTALFTLRLHMCENNLYALSQMAFLSSLTTMGRSIFSITSGWLVDHFGWEFLFFTASLCSIPGLLISLYISYKKKYPFLTANQKTQDNELFTGR